MAFDKVVDSIKLNSWLTDIGNSVRKKTGKKEKIPIENMPAEIDSITGGGENWFKYATSLFRTFKEAIFPSNTEFSIDISNVTRQGEKNALVEMFSGVSGVKKITLTSNTPFIGECQKMFYNVPIQAESLEELDINVAVFQPTRAELLFSQQKNLRYIRGEIDLSRLQLRDGSGVNFISGAFTGCKSLEEIRLKANTSLWTFGFPDSLLLSPESIQSIIDGLATVEAPQTLTLHPTVKAKLTPEQTQTISAKNWILA